MKCDVMGGGPILDELGTRVGSWTMNWSSGIPRGNESVGCAGWSTNSYVHSCADLALWQVVHRGRAPSHFWARIGQLLLECGRGDSTFFLVLGASEWWREGEQGTRWVIEGRRDFTCTAYKPRLS